MSVPNRLYLSLIERPTATKDDRQVLEGQTASWNLLAYLALAPGMSDTRTKLATFLWETSDELRGRRNLRQLLYRLRVELGSEWPGIVTNRDSISLNSDYVKTDVNEIFQALRSGHVPEILIERDEIQNRLLDQKNYYGNLLSSWVHMARRNFENRLQAALEPLLYEDGATERLRAARALLRLDPADETAACTLIETYWARGDVGRALRVYSTLWKYLDQEFGMEPGAVTQDLVVRMKNDKRPEAMPSQHGSAPDRLKTDIVVRKSEMHGISPAAVAAAGLFRTEVISNLLKFRQFRVIDAAVQDERGQYRLETSFAQTEKKVRMFATLIRESTGVVEWSDSFDDIRTGWWMHQANLTGGLAAACAISVSATRLSEIESKSMAQSAFDNWLLGQSLMLEFRLDKLAHAEKYFAECIRLAPKSSFGYSALSQLYNGRHLRGPQLPPSAKLFRKSKDLATTAISLDPLDTRAHLCRAWASCLLRQFEQADAGFAMAIECNRFDPWAVISAALGTAFCGNVQKATELLSFFREQRWIPTPQHWGYIASTRFVLNDFPGCIRAAENVGNVIENIDGWKAAALWQLGEKQSARSLWSEFAARIADRSDEVRPCNHDVRQWFLSSFPIQSPKIAQILERAVTDMAH